MIIDGLQYANWSPKIFRQMREGGVDAVHVTIAYHENFRETVQNIERWNRWFEQLPELICPARSGDDVRAAKAAGRTAIIFGFQNCSPIEDDIGLVEIVHTLGARFMQLSYNNQSLLATGCYESEDPGITRMGRQVIAEMNRVGLVIDMSHSAERSTLEAIEISERPIAITHANPAFWYPALRNKSDSVLRALAQSGGMIGFSLYPHHLKGKSDCTLESFCGMVARCAEIMGVERLGIGSDLCQDIRTAPSNGCGPAAGPRKSITAKGPGTRLDFLRCRHGLATTGISETSKRDSRPLASMSTASQQSWVGIGWIFMIAVSARNAAEMPAARKWLPNSQRHTGPQTRGRIHNKR